MKLSYHWLKNYIDTDLRHTEIAVLLTDCGLEVEHIEKFETIKGGLEGLVIGEVKSKTKHPDADKLSLTTVDVGAENVLNIVCGAPNVDVGQKVVVATIGATLYPTPPDLPKREEIVEEKNNIKSSQTPLPLGEGKGGEVIKKSKIRGQLSEGMICAEDEIGLGNSHEGIMVLAADAVVGMSAAEYFKIENDYIFEIGLTPNRADAASHIGVARDLVAVINSKLKLPTLIPFSLGRSGGAIEVIVEDTTACPRYSGISISGVAIKSSPDWLKNRLKSIGLKPINNVVDITNFVLHEQGQPLHVFDADKIKGNKVIVRKLAEGTKFKTLDGVERALVADDLMICNAEEGMCIAGVFGGIGSGVSDTTKNIFLESAYFNSVSIRKTSKHHDLKTDASFRYERGTDPNITVYALKRAAMLITEIAGGEISSEIIDVYPNPIADFKVEFNYKNCERLIGKFIEKGIIKNILTSLEIKIISENADGLRLSVPPFKVDVTREVDVIEEIMRIYGYNNVEPSVAVHSSLSFAVKPDREKIQNTISDLLSNNGFNEIMTNSLTNSKFATLLGGQVGLLNPLSNDLSVMRQTLLYSGLEAISYNQNRKNNDLKFYEFGKTYNREMRDGKWEMRNENKERNSQLSTPNSFKETNHLSLFLTGRKNQEQWNTSNENINFYSLKSFIENILERLSIKDFSITETSDTIFSYALSFQKKNKKIVDFGLINKSVLKQLDISQEVFYADFNWDVILELLTNKNAQFKELARFPEVRRDFALLIDKQIKYEEIEKLAYQTERNILKKVNLFDVYEGDKLEEGKKSYAVSFTLQDDAKTLTDSQIDKTMERLQKSFEEKLGAKLR